jgi:O-antigen/teichoic acid export membrane protein
VATTGYSYRVINAIKQLFYPWFRWSEKYLKTDTIYLAKGGFWLAIGQGVAMASGLALSLAFANLFPKEAFGNYKFIIAVTGVLGVFTLTETGTAIARAVAHGFGGSFTKGVRTSLIWSTGVLIGGLGLGAYYFLNENYILSISFVMAGIFIPITTAASLYGAFLLGKKDFRRITLYGAVRNIFPAASLIVTLFLTDSLLIIMLVYFASAALVSVFLYYRTRQKYKNENNEHDPALTSYSKHLSFMEFIGLIANHIDKILIFHYLGAAPLAIYAFAIAPVEQLQGGKKILSSLILPKISERSFEELQESGPRKALLLTMYALALAGIYILIAPYFYKYLYPQYIDAVLYSQVYALTLLAVSGTIFDSTLIAHKKTRELYTQRTVLPILKIVLFFTLLPSFGIMGLVVSHVIIRTTAGLFGYYLVTHPFKK